MRQDLVDRVRELAGDRGADDTFVRAELARALDDLRYGSVRLRPAASILRREEPYADVDEGELVQLAARRVASLGGTEMPARDDRADDLRLGTATRAYEATFSFGSRCELPRENAARESRPT
jgi:hypothetical protein